MSETDSLTRISLISVIQNEQWRLLNMTLDHPKLYSYHSRDENYNTILHILVQKEGHTNYNFIQRLTSIIDVNERNAEGKTPLHFATQNGCLDTAEQLIIHGANVNILNKYGHSALYYATCVGNMKMVQLLCANGCDMCYRDRQGWNVLHLATKGNFKTLIVFFIMKGVDMNGLNSWGQTPLEVAIEVGHTEIALVLIEYGADTRLCSAKQGSLLHKSIKLNNQIITKILLKTLKTTTVDSEHRTPLHLSVECPNNEITKLLLKKGSNINISDQDGYTPLHIAVQHGRTDIIEIFINHAKPSQILFNSTEALSKEDFLIDRIKLNVYKTSNVGDNILHLLAASNLCEQKKMDVFYTLLKLNLKNLVVLANRDFRTPLHFAYDKFCRPLVTAFISLGADVEEVDRFGKRPRDYCTLPDGGKIRIIKRESFTKKFVKNTM